MNNISENSAINILLIHKEEQMKRVLHVILADKGFNFIEANSGVKGWMKNEHNDFDMIIIDESLADTDGCSLLRRFTQEYPELPIIFLINNVTSQSYQDALALGAFAIVEKPVKMNQLSLLLMGAFAKNSTQRAHHVSDDSYAPSGICAAA
jgi:DNA-binding NtrC family response regulator